MKRLSNEGVPKFELIRTLSVAKVLDHFVVCTMRQSNSSVNLQSMSNYHFFETLNMAYSLMRTRFGHLHWWPADDAFEVCAGAILMQNTNWKNVEKAIEVLKKERCLTPAAICKVDEQQLAEWIRSAGYHNLKAHRLKSFVSKNMEDYEGGLASMLEGDTTEARERLLNIHGIGPETADCMLLCAGGHASFVMEACTRRAFFRHGWCSDSVSYDELKNFCEAHIKVNNTQYLMDYWKDYHAQFLEIGKSYYRPSNPKCGECPLEPLLPAA